MKAKAPGPAAADLHGCEVSPAFMVQESHLVVSGCPAVDLNARRNVMHTPSVPSQASPAGESVLMLLDTPQPGQMATTP